MAQSKSFYDDIKKEIECPLCEEQFSENNEPKVLQCQHTFCKSCLEGWLRQHSEGALTCPNCRRRTECPNNNIDCLPSNLAYKKLIDILKTYRKNEDQEETFCELHKEKVKFYCEQCEICICSECVVMDHRDRNFHNVISLEEGAKKQKAKIERKIGELSANSSRLKIFASFLEKRRALANKSIEEATKEVQRVAERCINSIRQHESSMTELLKTQKSNCNDDYSKELSKLTEKIQRMENISAESKNILQRNNLQEMLNIKQVLDEKIAVEVLPELTYPEFKYISDDALSLNFTPGQLYKTNSEPSLSVATGDGLTKGTQGKEDTFTVTTNDSKGQATYSEIDNVRVDIKSSQKEIEDIRSVVKDLKNGHYFISYTPTIAGNFSVSIKVRDEPIKGSPFTLVITKDNGILKPGKYMVVDFNASSTTSYGLNCFCYLASKLWNSLPENYRTVSYTKISSGLSATIIFMRNLLVNH